MNYCQPGQPQNLLEPSAILQTYAALVQKHAQNGTEKPGRMNLLGWDLEYPTLSILATFVDYILFRRINDFLPDNDEPVILDCGANIGYTVLNYKRQFPKARIIAFEPDPDILPYLHSNLTRNGADDVEVVEAAAWVSDGRASWFREGIDGSRIVENVGDVRNIITVPTVKLRRYLNRNVDLLKVDIEGAEFSLIPQLGEGLKRVKNILIECHITHQDKYRQFAHLIQTLKKQGFNLSINSYGAWRDLIRRHTPLPPHSEQYLLICGWRESSPLISDEVTVMPFYGAQIAKDLEDWRNCKEEQTNITNWLVKEYIHPEQVISRQFNTIAKILKWHRNRQICASSWLANRYIWRFVKGAKKLAKVLQLTGPFIHVGGKCWSCELPTNHGPGDTSDTPVISSLLIFENNILYDEVKSIRLGPPHAEHEDIIKKGQGRYSHWHTSLYFSTSDSTDPNTNGRTYTVISLSQNEIDPSK